MVTGEFSKHFAKLEFMAQIISTLFHSIQSRLIAMIVIIALVIVGLILFFSLSIQERLTEEADLALLLNARVIANRIDEFNRSNLQTFQLAARLPTLVNYIKADAEERELARPIALDTLREVEFYPYDQFNTLSRALLDESGIRILESDTDQTQIDESQRTYFQEALLTGQPYISEVSYGERSGGINFFYSVPVRQFDGPGLAIGVLRIRVGISAVQDIVFQADIQEPDTEIMLFDNKLVRIADNDHSEGMFRTIDTLPDNEMRVLQEQGLLASLPPFPLPDLARQINALEEGTAVFTAEVGSHHDEPARITVVRLETAPWYLVVSRPVSLHFGALQGQRQGMILLVIALTSGIALLSIYLSKRISQPIRELTRVAAQVRQGNLKVTANVTSRDEIGVLAETFNQMTVELSHINATLEDRVMERTQALLEANSTLQQEISERQRYEKRAISLALEHERRQLLSKFIQDASHEFRTPLSIINVKLHLLTRRDEMLKPHLESIQDQSKNIAELVDAMILMTRLNSGILEPAQSMVLNHFATMLYQQNTELFETSSLQFELKQAAEDLWIEADPELLRIAVQQILVNAQRYTLADGKVTLTTRHEKGQAVLVVSDTGIGIDKEEMVHVFEQFYRVDKAHTTRGFGLGLPIARRIIEHYKGTIELSSQIGQGTTVSVSFPIAEPIAAGEADMAATM